MEGKLGSNAETYVKKIFSNRAFCEGDKVNIPFAGGENVGLTVG